MAILMGINQNKQVRHMEILLIKKQIKAVAKTYSDTYLPLTNKEENELLKKIETRISESNQPDVRDIVQDIVYSFFTGQDDE